MKTKGVYVKLENKRINGSVGKGVWAKSRKTRQIKHNEQYKHSKEELRKGNLKLIIQTRATLGIRHRQTKQHHTRKQNHTDKLKR